MRLIMDKQYWLAGRDRLFLQHSEFYRQRIMSQAIVLQHYFIKNKLHGLLRIQ